jgi:hypothetical protein
MRVAVSVFAGAMLFAATAAQAQSRTVTDGGSAGIGGGPDCSSWNAPAGYRYQVCDRSTVGGVTRWACCLQVTRTYGGPRVWEDPDHSGDETTPPTHQWSGDR